MIVKQIKSRKPVWLIFFTAVIIILFFTANFFFSSQFFKIFSIEYRTGLSIPDGTEVIQFKTGDSMFAKLELSSGEFALLENEILSSSYCLIENEYMHPYPDRMSIFCRWWDIDPTLIDHEYLLSASSNEPGNFGLRQIYIYTLLPQENTITAYIAVIGK